MQNAFGGSVVAFVALAAILAGSTVGCSVESGSDAAVAEAEAPVITAPAEHGTLHTEGAIATQLATGPSPECVTSSVETFRCQPDNMIVGMHVYAKMIIHYTCAAGEFTQTVTTTATAPWNDSPQGADPMADLAGGEVCTSTGTFSGPAATSTLLAFEQARTGGPIRLVWNMVTDLTVRPCRAASDDFLDRLQAITGPGTPASQIVPVAPSPTCVPQCDLRFRCNYDVNSSYAHIEGLGASDCSFGSDAAVAAQNAMCGTWGVASQISSAMNSCPPNAVVAQAAPATE